MDAIEMIVCSWLIRYKHPICLVRLNHETQVPRLISSVFTTQTMAKLIHVLANDLNCVLDEVPYDDEYKVIREYSGNSILIQDEPDKENRYVVVRNVGYILLKQFLYDNTGGRSATSDRWARQVVICEWFRRFNCAVRYEHGAKPMSLDSAVNVLEFLLRREDLKRTTTKRTTQSTATPNPTQTQSIESQPTATNTTRTPTEIQSKENQPAATAIVKVAMKKVVPSPVVRTQCQTRATYAKMTELINSGSHSKRNIQYTADKRRHFVGETPKLKRLHGLMFIFSRATAALGDHGLDEETIEKRLFMMRDLESIHSALIHLQILSPRDQWEDWIDNFMDEPGCDRAFMCLLVIIMSSSTADVQLANIVPRLFSSGLTSAIAVVQVAQQYGLNTFCSLFSEGGRYYQNAERILNAADYFVQKHGGRVPTNISVLELCTLFGVGYKTANIVVTTAFRRIDGIPSDIHVIRWSSMLGWCPPTADGLRCSKMLEAWLPHSVWESINPVFGAFGQLLVSEQREQLLHVSQQHSSPVVRKLFRKAAFLYKRLPKANA